MSGSLGAKGITISLPPSSLTLDQLNILQGHLTPTQLDGLQNINNLPTGDTQDTFVGSDGDTQVHRLVNVTTLASNNEHGNTARYTSVFSIVPSIPAGRHYINPNPNTYSFGDLVEADGVTPVVGTTTLALAKTAFGALVNDHATGKMLSIGDLALRDMNSIGTGWGWLSSIKTENGFTGWHPMNRNEAEGMVDIDARVQRNGPLDYMPFDRTQDQWTSTESQTGFGYFLNASNAVMTDFFNPLGNTHQCIYIRDNRLDP